jgi:hypothetical protein
MTAVGDAHVETWRISVSAPLFDCALLQTKDCSAKSRPAAAAGASLCVNVLWYQAKVLWVENDGVMLTGL